MKKQSGRREFLAACGRCALALAGSEAMAAAPAVRADASGPQKGYLGRRLSPYFTPLKDGSVRCDLCPRQCEVADGDRGYCGVRENVKGEYYSLVYGNPCAVRVDPVEKKPFFHVLPGTRSFSLATAGCNFDCKFCQNWEISQARPDDTFNYRLAPKEAVETAARSQCASIASTYVEPTIFAEYMIDIGKLTRGTGILNVMHSNGYISPKPLADLCEYLDAACVDLKGITEQYYRDITEGELKPVQETLKTLKRKGIHTELVNLMVPGLNDSEKDVRALSKWVKNELGADTPVHFTRFYPLYKLKSLPPTPVSTLERARGIGLAEGLRYVYIGNVPGHEAEHTRCPDCGELLVERVGYRVKLHQFKDGHCTRCGAAIPGIWRTNGTPNKDHSS